MDNTTILQNTGGAGHAQNSVEPSPSPSPRPSRSLKHMPSIQRVNTTFSQSFTVTPASAHSTSSVAPSPSWSSLQGSPVPYQTQLQAGQLSSVEPFSLPEAVSAPPTSAGSTISSSASRQNGLTRKLSSGRRALSKLGRTASGTSSRRNVSSGPVARRRSDSKTSTAATFDSRDPVPDLPEGLPLCHSINSPDDTGSVSDCHIRYEQRAEVIAPSVPSLLVGGTWLSKITRRRRSEKLFSLDKEGSKVSWVNTVKRKEFYIDDIKSIRLGIDVENLWTEIGGTEIDLSRCFTINYAPSESSKSTKSLNLVAPSRDLCQLWVKTLDALSKHREELMSEMTGTERQSVLRTHWESELAKQNSDDNVNGTSNLRGLGLAAVSRLCRKLHIHCPKTVIEEVFRMVDSRSIGLLDFEEFRAFVARLRSRADLLPLFSQLRSPHVDGIPKETFFRFLANEQGIKTDLASDYWLQRFETLAAKSMCAVPADDLDRYMDFAGFISFMMSKDCHVYSQGPEKLRPNLDQPLNDYFISSSHNTYLVGWQVNGTSSMEAYMTALRRGCRSVEIDCWNGENGEPRVTHGFTNTTSVAFVDVIRTINRCAFEVSPYPVTLSLEVHCNPAQQLRMVEIMKECIDSTKLVLMTLPHHESTLPSPEELKYKILVKVKATNAHPMLSLPSELSGVRPRSASSPIRGSLALSALSSQQHLQLNGSPSMMSPSESLYSPTDRSVSPTSEDDESDTSVPAKNAADANAARKTSKITTELAALGVYLQGYSFGSPADLEFERFNHIFSINENAAAALSKNQETKAPFEKHNTSFMCRVYPKNVRLNSSNFDPNTFWRRGVQMVALNWQTYDIHMQMNQAMFAAGNDQSGYVLKPSYLRDPQRFDGFPESRAKLPRHRITFSVKVISAQQLPLLSTLGRSKPISPYVEVQMFSAEDKARGIAHGQGGEETSRSNGYHGIGVPLTRRTKTVPDNGFNPQFNEMIDLALDTKYPELVFVRFVVRQAGKNSGKELAVFTAKLDSLQHGYRHLPLYNSRGEELIFSTLFCQITKRPNTVAISEVQPERSHSLRKLLSRNNTERGRSRGHTLAESERSTGEKRWNEENEAQKR